MIAVSRTNRPARRKLAARRGLPAQSRACHGTSESKPKAGLATAEPKAKPGPPSKAADQGLSGQTPAMSIIQRASASSDNAPRKTVTACPASFTRSPMTSTFTDPAAGGDLPADQRRLPEPAGPERAKHAMGRARDRVLVNADAGHEHAADEVAAAAVGLGGDDGTAVRRLHRGEIGRHLADSPRVRTPRPARSSRRCICPPAGRPARRPGRLPIPSAASDGRGNPFQSSRRGAGRSAGR